MNSLGVKSQEDSVRKICGFKGEDWKEYHHKVKNCVMEKAKDNPRVKEWEEKKKTNKEEFKKDKKEAMVKSVTCKEQVLGIQQ